MASVTLKLEGMKCGGCAATVQQKLGAVPGVTDVRVSLDDKTATATGDERVTTDVLAGALAGTKFKVLS